MDELFIEKSLKEQKEDAEAAINELYHHMLKWDHQRHIQTPSWSDSINKQAKILKKSFKNTNVEAYCIDSINKFYLNAVNRTKDAAADANAYFTSKMSKTLPDEYQFDFILDDDNRYKWIHSRCGNRLLKTSDKFKYDTIHETDVRILPRDSIK